MTLESAKTLAEIITFTLAGLWAIFGFFVLKHREKATADLRKAELEMQTMTLELRRIAVVRTDISATSFRRPDGPGYCIVAQVSLTNTGGRETRIAWDGTSPAFFVRRASFGSDGAPTFTHGTIAMRARQARNVDAEVVSTIIRPGASEQLAFAANVEAAGVYLLSFRGPVAEQDRVVSVEAGAASHNPTSWTAHHYLAVTESSSPETTSRTA
jgi:hypothetical protein